MDPHMLVEVLGWKGHDDNDPKCGVVSIQRDKGNLVDFPLVHGFCLLVGAHSIKH